MYYYYFLDIKKCIKYRTGNDVDIQGLLFREISLYIVIIIITTYIPTLLFFCVEK